MTRLTSEKTTQERKTKMPSKRNMMTKEDADLFQKATEAMRILGESPDAARRFLDAVKNGDFSGARMSLNASMDRRREEKRVGVPLDKRTKRAGA
jgi:hypothetical protein